MTEEEKIILEKENEIKLLKKELDKISKKVEEAKTTKAINDIRIKELQKNINKPSSFNKTKNNKKFSKNIKSKIRNNFNSSDKKNKDFGDVLTNIKLVQNLNYDINQKSQEKSNEVEPTINLINRKLPFSISALDNIINEKIERKKEDQKTMNENENSNEISIDSKKEVPINISESEDFYEINMEKSNLIDLTQGLKPKESLKEYFKRTLDYYKTKKNLEMKNYYLFDLAKEDYFSLKDKFVFKIDSDKSPFVSSMFQFLKVQLMPVKNTNNKTVYKEYQGPESFGYLLYQNTEYFYVFKNDYNRELFNDINRVKECELEKKSQ